MKLHEAAIGAFRILLAAIAAAVTYSEFGAAAAVALFLTTMAVIQ